MVVIDNLENFRSIFFSNQTKRFGSQLAFSATSAVCSKYKKIKTLSHQKKM